MSQWEWDAGASQASLYTSSWGPMGCTGRQLPTTPWKQLRNVPVGSGCDKWCVVHYLETRWGLITAGQVESD